jgi:branched-chain amino acid transport system substrate-binding protein
MGSIKRSILTGTTAAALVASAMGCSNGGDPNSAAGTSSDSITIGSMAPLTNPTVHTPGNKDAMEAAVAAINDAGGVNGRKLVLEFCDTNYDANQELNCTRQLIRRKVSAIIDPNILADPSGKQYEAAAAAKVPVIGSAGLSPAELNSPVVFPLSSGVPGWVYGEVASLVAAGIDKIAILGDTNPASMFFTSLLKDALESAGIEPVATITADAASDPTLATAAAQAASSGADGIAFAPGPQNVPKLIAGLEQAGYQGKISSLTPIFQQPIIDALGSSGDGIMLTSTVAFLGDTQNPGIKQFLADMDKYQPDTDLDENAVIAWSAVKLFAEVAGTLDEYDSAAILDAFSQLKQPIDLGTVGPYSVSGKLGSVPGFERIVNPFVQGGVLEGGEIHPNGKGFVNPFTALANAK